MGREAALFVPDIGSSDKIELVAWYVKSGESIRHGQEICELVTDKAAFPLESPHAGVMGEFLKNEGESVLIHEKIATLLVEEG